MFVINSGEFGTLFHNKVCKSLQFFASIFIIKFVVIEYCGATKRYSEIGVYKKAYKTIPYVLSKSK